MATEWISPIWRMPNDKNQSKFESYSLDFDGGSEYIIIGSSTELDNVPSNPYSFSFWFKSSTAGRVLSEKRAVNNLLNAQYTIHLESGYIKWYGGADGITSGTQTSTTLVDDQWHHIVCVAESTTVNKIYVDGQLDVTSSANRINSAVVAGTFNIGANYVGSYRFIGQLSQYCIFDYAFSEGQISYLYNSGTPQNPMAISGQPPVAYYPLGGSSTGDAAAASPNTLTVPNESVPSATVFDFNSSNINVGDIDNAGALSFSTWLSTTSTNASSYQNIAYKRNGSTGWFIQYLYGSGTDGKIKFYIFHTNGVGTGSEVTITNLQSGDWFNIALTYDGTDAVGALKLYSNGTEVYSNSSTLGGTGIAVNNDDLYFGGSASSAFFTCKLSNIQLWDTGLSAPNVTTLYNNGVPLLSGTQPQAANLRAWYPMNVDNANWEADTSNNWQIADAVSSYPQSFNFGPYTDYDYVEVPRAAVNVTDAICVSGWIKTQTNTSQRQVVISNYESTNVANNGCWSFQVGDGWSSGYTKMEFWCRPASEAAVFDVAQTSGQVITDNKWHHVVALWDGTTTTNAVKIFVDGLLAGQGTAPATAPIKTATTSRPSMGRSASDSTGAYGGGYWLGGSGKNGYLSNVQVWDSALTYGSVSSIGDAATGQIAELYNNGSPLTTAIESSNLKLWAKLDNSATFSTNWSIPDASGNGNTGTSSGMTEQNLVNNNVSALNGTSNGMTTANLVNSDLTRSIPYSSYSMEFDGTADHIDCGATAYLDNLTEMSCSIWFNLDTSAINKGLIDDNDKHFAIYTKSVSGSDYSFRININGSANRVNITGTPFTAGQWHHLVMTFNAGTLTFYADGIVVGSTVYSGSIPTSLSGTTGNLDIGTYGTLYWDGKISNAAIFNAVLTQDQVLTIYNGGVPNSISSLSPIGWWSLAGDSYFNGSDWICPDLGSGGNNGTSSGMGGSELVGNAPGGSANGTATNMDIPSNLKGDAPNSSSNAFSVNMNSADRVASVPS